MESAGVCCTDVRITYPSRWAPMLSASECVCTEMHKQTEPGSPGLSFAGLSGCSWGTYGCGLRSVWQQTYGGSDVEYPLWLGDTQVEV